MTRPAKPPRPHWILGYETHVGREYFSLECFERRRDALARMRDELEASPAELQELSRFGRLAWYGDPARAERVGCGAVELVRCTCEDASVHEG